MKRLLSCSIVLLTAFSVAGCATTSKTQTADSSAVKPIVKTTRVQKSAPGTITIEKGQTLWSIARSGNGFGKACNWPLLYKANKTDVQDPDLIYPGQVLNVPKNVTAVESDNACKAAGIYGPYEPHTKPRTKINLDF
jgi:LysM repeat protein